jgi:hypothetical protein
MANSFSAAWTWVSNLFVSVWEGIKGVVTGFVEWLSPVVDMILAPFRAIGNVIGGIIGSVKSWFGETVEIGKTELAAMNENKMALAAAKPVQNGAPAPATQTAAPAAAPAFTASVVNAPGPETASLIAAPALTATGAVAAPSPVLPVAPSASAGTITAGADTALTEHLAAASRKGIAGNDISVSASDAFATAGASAAPVSPGGSLSATVTPGVDMAELNRQAQTSPFMESLAAANTAVTPAVDMAGLNRQAQTTPFMESLATANTAVTPGAGMADFERGAALDFQEAVRPRQAAVETPWREPERQPKKETPRVFNIKNVNLSADDIYHLLDFALQLELAVHEPVEALV